MFVSSFEGLLDGFPLPLATSSLQEGGRDGRGGKEGRGEGRDGRKGGREGGRDGGMEGYILLVQKFPILCDQMYARQHHKYII